ncbi:hypothetical protein Tco_0716365 [Tanacetum coccineum]
MTSRGDQINKDNALVALENQKAFGKCNIKIDPRMKRPKETTYQIVMDALALTTCYPALLMFRLSICINSGIQSTNTVLLIDSRSATRSSL